MILGYIRRDKYLTEFHVREGKRYKKAPEGF